MPYLGNGIPLSLLNMGTSMGKHLADTVGGQAHTQAVLLPAIHLASIFSKARITPMPAKHLHPVFHSHSSFQASRIDLDQSYPSDLEDADIDDLLARLNQAPRFIERISPVNTVLGDQMIKARTWSEMMMKSYRLLLHLLANICYYIQQTSKDDHNERVLLPFMGLDMEPDTLSTMIEQDYEQGENAYNSYMDLFQKGAISPTATTPFHAPLPLLPSAFDQRLMIQVGLRFYWQMVKSYHEYIQTNHGDQRFIMTVWLPECAVNHEIVCMLHEEFQALAAEEDLNHPHLILLLDNVQVKDTDIDILMKSWNQVRVGPGEKDVVTVLFRDRGFSDWVTYQCPSVKKLIDRTIAKVDAELNSQEVDYCWSHFEEFESLTVDSKAAGNFHQKVVKFAQLSYLPISPDMFVRRKLNGRFGKAKHEPQEIFVRDNTAWTDWHNRPSLGRWTGTLDSNAGWELVDENRPYTRRTRLQRIQETGSQSWKIALSKARKNCAMVTLGDSQSLEGGILGFLGTMTGQKNLEGRKQRVHEFLMRYATVHWKEHYLQQDFTEADTDITVIVEETLFQGQRKRVTDEEVIIAGLAARSYYFVLESYRSQATAYENLDQRAVYQAVTMLALGMCGAVTAFHWAGQKPLGQAILQALKTELIGFAGAFDRYRLTDYGITEGEWNDALKAATEESNLNVVERCARRLAAIHLRPLGYQKDFPREDEYLTTNCGHIWTAEVEVSNYKWENKYFCGLREE
jgi:hypothetical protein